MTISVLAFKLDTLEKRISGVHYPVHKLFSKIAESTNGRTGHHLCYWHTKT